MVQMLVRIALTPINCTMTPSPARAKRLLLRGKKLNECLCSQSRLLACLRERNIPGCGILQSRFLNLVDMLDSYPLWLNIAVFALAAAVIAWAGTRLAGFADELADRTGLGEAITGTIFLGLTTALPGLAASIFAALDGRPALAISNAIGGIAIQTAFLALADIAHRKANLEHAAASVTNMIQATMLIILLALVLAAMTGPDVTIAHIHPMTPLLLLAAAAGFWLVFRSSNEPMWQPKQTPDTLEDVPDASKSTATTLRLVLGFIVCALLITGAGVLVADTTGTIADRTAMSETVAGGLLSGVATSLPELVTTIAAVRRGALTLAVSDIVGGNFFDVLFVAAADFAYLQGSLYHASAVGDAEIFLGMLAILLNLILLLGLLFRQRTGPANIGFESVLMLIVYVAGFVIVWAGGAG